MKTNFTPTTTPTLYEQARAVNMNPYILPNWNYNDRCYKPNRTLRRTHEQALVEAHQIINVLRPNSGDYVWSINVTGNVLTTDLNQRSYKHPVDNLTIAQADNERTGL